MVEQSPGDGTATRRLTGGAIASLSGVGLLMIFMIQNTDDVNLDFRSGALRGRSGCGAS
jgi:hypothetical protein